MPWGGGLKKEKNKHPRNVFSQQFWRPEDQNQGVDRAVAGECPVQSLVVAASLPSLSASAATWPDFPLLTRTLVGAVEGGEVRLSLGLSHLKVLH